MYIRCVKSTWRLYVVVFIVKSESKIWPWTNFAVEDIKYLSDIRLSSCECFNIESSTVAEKGSNIFFKLNTNKISPHPYLPDLGWFCT